MAKMESSEIDTPIQDSEEACNTADTCMTGDWSQGYSRCALFGGALVGTEVHDSNICPHGPQGCMHVVREATAQQNRETDYAESGMTQRDVLYGGHDTLIAAYLETMGEYIQAGPKISISTCAPEIIGDNLQEIVARINPKLPVVEVSGGFQGNQYYGLNETLRKIVMKLADPQAKPEPGLVNVIGNIGGSMQWRADVREMSRLLSALGLTVNPLACNSTMENVRRSSHAEATILLTEEIGKAAAEYLQKTHNCIVVISPFGLPLGLRGTEAWLRAVSKALHVDPARLNEVLAREEEEVRIQLKVGLNNIIFIEKTYQLKQMPVSIVAEGLCALSWARFVSEELEMSPRVLGLRTKVREENLHPDLKKWLDNSNNHAVLVEPSIEAVKQAQKQHRPHLVLGSSLESEMVRDLGLPSFIHMANPNTQYVNLVEKPFLGYQGMVNICELILNTI